MYKITIISENNLVSTSIQKDDIQLDWSKLSEREKSEIIYSIAHSLEFLTRFF